MFSSVGKQEWHLLSVSGPALGRAKVNQRAESR